MKNAALWVAGLFFALTATAQTTVKTIEASGHKVKQQRATQAYTALNVTGSFEVLIVNGHPGEISIEGAENLAELVITEVKDSTLYVSLEKGYTVKPSRANKITVKIPYAEYSSITLNGSGSISSHKTFHNNIALKMIGAGSMDFYVYTQKAEARVYGAGSITLRGYIKSSGLNVNGSGAIDAKHLETMEADASVIGCGGIKLATNNKIKGRINGSGTIAFTGSPEEQDLVRTGTGTFEVF